MPRRVSPTTSRPTSRRRVYIANTGGTIGMQRSPDGYCPARGFLAQQMAAMPEFSHQEMPLYTIAEGPRLLDSANMTPQDWERIGADILAHYPEYDGFVVIHGTDTMAYSAAALSYMFEHLGKPIVFTGSQIPLIEIRSDARENLITSMLVAAHEPVPEVCIFFGGRLLRGNRATKVSAFGFRAFDSPNYPPLGAAGVHLEIERRLLLPLPTATKVSFRTAGDAQVADIRVFPGITAATLNRFLEPPLQGAVLHTYGVGNAPQSPDLLAALRAATERGVVLINCTQCLEGSVDMTGYATGRALQDAGVISGYDMTPEAALTKLYFLLSQNLARETVLQQLQTSLRGELTRMGQPSRDGAVG